MQVLHISMLFVFHTTCLRVHVYMVQVSYMYITSSLSRYMIYMCTFMLHLYTQVNIMFMYIPCK